MKKDEILHQIEEFKDGENDEKRPTSNFLVNLRSFLRLINITNFAPNPLI